MPNLLCSCLSLLDELQPCVWIQRSGTDIILWLTFINVLKGHEESCRVCRLQGRARTRRWHWPGRWQRPVPAAGSWLALTTALPRAATATHCSAFWGNSGSSGSSAPLPCSVLGQSAVPASQTVALCFTSITVPLFAQFTASAPFPKIQFFPFP